MKNISYILAVLTLITAMSILPSCKKETLKYQNEVAIIINGLESNSIKDYPGSVKVYEYAVSKLGHGNVTVTASVDGNISVENNFNKEEKKGKLTFTFPDEEKQNGIVNLSITDGINNSKIEIETATYFFNVEGSPVTLGATLIATAELNLTINTDIPDVAIAITPAENAFFSVEGETVSVTSENHTGENRISYVEVSEVSGKMKSYKIEVTQESAPARNDIVIFSDANFKKVMLEIADKDNDGEVDFEEALQVKEINIANRNIVSLHGLEYFKNIEKIDAMNNDIKDANIISELNYLHWIELRGNKNLVTIDFTGCCFYFDWCRFDINEKLNYKQYKRQVGICTINSAGGYRYSNDPTGEHATFIDDERITKDWSHQDNLILIQNHTKGNGKNKIVFTGVGYIDLDIENGTFNRIMTEAMETMFERVKDIKNLKEYFDIYFVERISEKHNYWINTEYGYLNERNQVFRYCYNLACGFDKNYDAYNLRDYDEYNYNVLTTTIDIYPNIKNPFPGFVLTGTNHPENIIWLNWFKDDVIFEGGISVYSNNGHVSDHKDNFNPEYYVDFVNFVKESNNIQ